MHLHCEFEAPVAGTDLADYIRHLEISARCYDEDTENEYVVGKLAIDQLMWMDAQIDRVSLFDICDADSQGWHEVHTILTRGQQEFRSGLRIKNEVTSHVVFLHTAVFHPSIHPYRQGIVDAALHLLGAEHLAVMWNDTSGLSESELANLGFRKIANSELIYRHSSLRTPFGDAHPTGQDIDFVATPEHEAWVIQEWKKRFER